MVRDPIKFCFLVPLLLSLGRWAGGIVISTSVLWHGCFCTVCICLIIWKSKDVLCRISQLLLCKHTIQSWLLSLIPNGWYFGLACKHWYLWLNNQSSLFRIAYTEMALKKKHKVKAQAEGRHHHIYWSLVMIERNFLFPFCMQYSSILMCGISLNTVQFR